MENVVSAARAAALVAFFAASSAGATEAWTNGIDGVGRISVTAGWKLSGQDWFFNQSAGQGYGIVTRGIGGPQAVASFGYGAIRWLEVSIDLFIGHDSFQIEQFSKIHVLTYGALVGVRAVLMDLFIPGLAPFIGVSVGPTLGYVFTGQVDQTFERLVTGVAGTAGIQYRFTDYLGLSLEYRLLYARGVWVTSGVNVGGSFFSLGVTIYFPRSPTDSSRMLGGP